ncbi:MAG: hypothetical protein KAT85_09225 [candidate division Zixibacteria bacterium]|nr:hypothetical protein [candidate division Zixibacteria bacterium]
MPEKRLVTVIYTDIGRGHPNYLDSVLRHLEHNHPAQYRNMRITSIFEISSGMSFLAWKAVEKMYKFGARGGVISSIYSRFRSGQSEYNPNSMIVRILRRDLLWYLNGNEGVCLVAHPLLANMLREQHRVFYLHGEIAAPRESAVTGIERVYVPLPETLEKMLDAGVDRNSLVATGLVLEPELCADLSEVARKRTERIDAPDFPLTVGFFISGAYPKKHVELMLKGAESLHHAGHKVRFFWGRDKRKAEKLMLNIRRFDQHVKLDAGGTKPLSDVSTVVVTGKSRTDETIRSLRYLPELDLFCAAPHERVNWAVGAGLPIIMITPTIGTFAPENLDFVLRSKCGIEWSDEQDFIQLADILSKLRHSGRLPNMVTAGRRIKSVNGAKTIAEDLIAAFET